MTDPKAPTAAPAAPAAPAPGTAVVSWKEKMAGVMAVSAAMEAPKGGYLSFKGGNMSYDEQMIPHNKLDVVVLNFVLENAMFREKYVAGKTASPMCYAIGRMERDLKPHPDCEEPQNDQCGVPGEEGCCPHNEWGSDPDGGKGKACKNGRRIAIMSADFLGHTDAVDRIKAANVLLCKIPVTSIKGFSSYVNQCVKVAEKPTFAMVTELSTKPHPTSLFTVNWKIIDDIKGDDILHALYDRHVAADRLVTAPYPANEEPAPAPAPRTAKKF